MRAGETGEGDDAEVAAFQQWLDDNVENELLQKMSFLATVEGRKLLYPLDGEEVEETCIDVAKPIGFSRS